MASSADFLCRRKQYLDLESQVEGDVLDCLLQSLHREGEGVGQLVLLAQLLPGSREVALHKSINQRPTMIHYYSIYLIDGTLGG